MPDSTISAPVAADPIDRLALGATDAREIAVGVHSPGAVPGTYGSGGGICMVEE
jgi:hypothetical protein